MTRASIVIPVYERADLLRACLASLDAAGLDGVEIVLVDNASGPEVQAVLDTAEGGCVVRRNPVNTGFAAACNLGAELASAPVVVFLNTDTEVHAGWLDPLLAAVADPRVGMAGSRLLYPGGRVQHAGMALGPGAQPVHIHRGAPGDLDVVTRTRDLTLVTGACLAMRRDLFREHRGFDEAYRNGFEDADLGLRLADHGLVARYCGDSVVTHHESMSPGRTDAEGENGMLFRTRWAGRPGDWDRLLGEDGVPAVRAADVLWLGPLFDGTPQAALGVALVCDLADAGRFPAAREGSALPAAPGAPCPPHVLAALNRYGMGAPPVVLTHESVADGAVNAVNAAASLVVAGPGRGAGTAARRAAVDAVIAAGAEAAATLAAPPAVPVVRVDPARPGLADGPLAGRLAPARHGVGWWGPLVGRSGYAAAGRGLLSAMNLTGRPVRALPADGDGTPLDGSAAIDPWAWVVHHVPVGPDGAAFSDRLSALLGRAVAVATCFESDGLPASWVAALGRAARVWVPGPFNRDTFAAAGVDPDAIRVVPYPVDTDALRPAAAPRPGDAPFTFLSVFEWTWRKGWDALLTAYCTEFTPADDVRLRILTYRGAGASGRGGDIPALAAGHIASLGLDPEAVADVELLLAPVDDAGLAELYRTSDAFVLPTRGEGAGMPVVEAMACGVPVVATDFGGHADLMTPDAAYPVEVERLVPAAAELVADNALYRGQRLAEPSVESLRAQMRAVYGDGQEAARRASRARDAVVATRSLPAAARALDAAVAELVDEARP